MVQIRLDLPEALHRQLAAQARSRQRTLEAHLLELMGDSVDTTETPESQGSQSLYRFPDDPMRQVQERYLATITRLQPEILAIQDQVLEAQLEAVRGCLEVAASEGLSGDHHFFIVFATRALGVELPDFLRIRFPETMKIVLQHQFSELEVESDLFSVVLWFGGDAYRLVVPFSALLAFSDPSVGLQMAFPPPAIEADEEVTAADNSGV